MSATDVNGPSVARSIVTTEEMLAESMERKAEQKQKSRQGIPDGS